MAVPVPVLGERGVYTWAQAVANQLNQHQLLVVPNSLQTNSATAADVTGMTFAVVNGNWYRIHGQLDYSCAQTNQGIGFGFRHPGGTARGLFQITGPSGGTTFTNERLSTSSADTDQMTTAATIDSTGVGYLVLFTVFYACTADGTFKFRMKRNGTSGSTGLTIFESSGAEVTASA